MYALPLPDMALHRSEQTVEAVCAMASGRGPAKYQARHG